MRSTTRREEVFVVRMWTESGADPAVWRASAKHVGSGEREGFARFEDLAVFLARCWSQLALPRPPR